MSNESLKNDEDSSEEFQENELVEEMISIVGDDSKENENENGFGNNL